MGPGGSGTLDLFQLKKAFDYMGEEAPSSHKLTALLQGVDKVWLRLLARARQTSIVSVG